MRVDLGIRMHCNIIEDARKEREKTFPNECRKVGVNYHKEIGIVVETVTLCMCIALLSRIPIPRPSAVPRCPSHRLCDNAEDVADTRMISDVKNCKGLYSPERDR